MQVSNSEIINAFTTNNISLLSTHYDNLKTDAVSDLPPAIRFVERCRQLDGVGKKLKIADRVRLALFIEKMIHNGVRKSDAYFKKSEFIDPLKPSYSLLYSPAGKSSYVLLKKAGNDILKAEGTSKKVAPSMQIPDDPSLPAVIITQAVNKIFYLKSHEFLENQGRFDPYLKEDYLQAIEEAKSGYAMMMDEVRKHQEFTGNEGIWPLLDFVEYVTVLSNRERISRVSSFTPLATSADKIMKGVITLSTSQFIDMARQVACGLLYLHNAGYIHGDLKPENILLDENAAGLIDFGLSFKNGEAQLKIPLNKGYYGSLVPTAPELFGNQNFDGDIFKAEVWAFGFLLYSLLFKQLPGWWELILPKKGSLDEKIDDQTKIAVNKKMKNEIETRRQALAHREQSLSIEEEFQLLIYDAMNVDLASRPDMQAIVQRIEGIKNRSCQLLGQ